MRYTRQRAFTNIDVLESKNSQPDSEQEGEKKNQVTFTDYKLLWRVQIEQQISWLYLNYYRSFSGWFSETPADWGRWHSRTEWGREEGFLKSSGPEREI